MEQDLVRFLLHPEPVILIKSLHNIAISEMSELIIEQVILFAHKQQKKNS